MKSHPAILLRLILTSCFLLCLISISFGQRAWEPGYIIESSGDTLRGQIQDDGRFNSNSILFRSNEGSGEQGFKVSDIYRISITNGKEFESIRIASLIPEIRLYEVITEGKADLLAIDNMFILRLNDTSYYELKKTVKSQLINGVSVKQESYPFRGLLNYLFAECGDVKNDIPTATLDRYNLSSLFEKYNSCFATEPMRVRKKEKKDIRFAVYAGWTTQNYNWESMESGAMFMDLTNPKGNSMSFGGNIEYAFKSKLSAVLDVSYFKTDLNFTSEVTDQNETNTIMYNSNNFVTKILFRAHFRTEGLVPYVSIGPTFSIASGESSYRYREVTIPPGIILSNDYTDFMEADILFGLEGGIGIKYQRSNTLVPFLECRGSFLSGNALLETSSVDTDISYKRNSVFVLLGLSIRRSGK